MILCEGCGKPINKGTRVAIERERDGVLKANGSIEWDTVGFETEDDGKHEDKIWHEQCIEE